MYLSIRLLLIFSLCFGANYFQPDISSLSRGKENPGSLNIPGTLKLVGIMAQFPLEAPDNPKTSGDGHFLNRSHDGYNHFFDSTTPRCDGFIVDRPPHNADYFKKQLEAVGNYYFNISEEALPYTHHIITNPDNPENGYFTVSNEMEYYAQSDQLLAEFFTEVIDSAKVDIELYLIDKNYSSDEVVFIVFHAGLSQDFSYPSIDPTIYDLKSAYIDGEMMQSVTPAVVLGNSIYNGIVLPETQNIIFYDVVEDIFGNPDYGTDDLCDIQIGLTGIFAFLLGYELGLPEMFNPKTGDPGIGFFGLMDHGSNNGRGIIPARPSPWTRIKAGWLDPIVINPNDGLEISITIPALDIEQHVYQIQIAEDEYFLIENRNNWVDLKTDIDSLRQKHNIYYPETGDSLIGHWFDSVTNDEEKFIQDSLIYIDAETQIITGFDHYDYGLPGSGILIWHIKEPDPSIYYIGVNYDSNNRHVQIKEADGAQDIGTKSYAFFASDDPTTGTNWDMWFQGNEGYEFANPGMDDKIIFDNNSSPNTRTTEGAESFISLEILSKISDAMAIRVRFNEDIEIVNLSDGPLQYLGNSYSDLDSISYVYYEQNDTIYRYYKEPALSIYSIEATDIEYKLNFEILSVNNDSMKYVPSNSWLDDTLGVHQEYIQPKGYIYEESIANMIDSSISHADSSLAFGDIDQDGLDEIITIVDGNIFARNGNETLVNGFPVKGKFRGVPLIANILPPQYGKDVGKPEIICREGDDIAILSSRGERLRQSSSFDIYQPLAMVPYWDGNKMALIDGSRIFLFDLDMDHSYWLNPRSRPSGYPLSTGLHELNISHNFSNQEYNYPNPITEGKTTFRFYVSSTETTVIQVKIYNSAGYLVADNLINDNLTPYEFNEIKWRDIQVDAGLYFAEIKPNVGPTYDLVRLVVIK